MFLGHRNLSYTDLSGVYLDHIDHLDSANLCGAQLLDEKGSHESNHKLMLNARRNE